MFYYNLLLNEFPLLLCHFWIKLWDAITSLLNIVMGCNIVLIKTTNLLYKNEFLSEDKNDYFQ